MKKVAPKADAQQKGFEYSPSSAGKIVNFNQKHILLKKYRSKLMKKLKKFEYRNKFLL